jgi:hypothetical protein
LVPIPGCYSYRLRPAAQAAPAPVSEHVALRGSYLWGLYEPPGEAFDCQGNGVTDVTTRSNLGFALLTVATLGGVALAEVEWSCAGDNDPEERID